MRKAKKSATQERLAKERAEQRAKTTKLKAARLAAAAKKTDELEQSAKRVAALYKSMREFEAHAEEKAGFELKKAAEKRAALEKALTEARELCKAAGQSFKAFHKKYAPDYKRTQLYQILAIADGRKTVEGIREEEREKKRRQRAGKVSGTSNVPDEAAEARAEPVAPVEQAEPAKTTGKKSSAKPAPVEPTESEMVVLTTGRLAGIAVIAPDPQEFIDQYGAEIAERYARSMLAKLGIDAPAASSTRAEAAKGKGLKPGEPLVSDDWAPTKEDGGFRRGIAEPSPGKLEFLISPLYDDDGKGIGQQVERRTHQGKAEATKRIAAGDLTYEDCKAAAQADFDAGGK
jgi:hypothetical protein